MSRFSSLLCSLLFCMITYAQEITVTGKVTAGGEEMPGVTVAVKGQTRGTITSIDGSYQIQVNGNESLIFSFVGYETVTIPVNRRKVINVELKEAAQMVDEVVITVPYGTAKKSTFTGSASYIAAGTIEKAQVSKSTARNCSWFTVFFLQRSTRIRRNYPDSWSWFCKRFNQSPLCG